MRYYYNINQPDKLYIYHFRVDIHITIIFSFDNSIETNIQTFLLKIQYCEFIHDIYIYIYIIAGIQLLPAI